MLETIIICITCIICCLITVGGINRSVWWISQLVIRVLDEKQARKELNIKLNQ